MNPILPALLFATGICFSILPFPAAPSQAPAQGAMANAPKITPFLWFDDNAETAVRYYLAVFPGAKLVSETRWGEGGPVPKGTLMLATFELAGQTFMALNGGPRYRFNGAVSFMIRCETQQEIDSLWAKLTSDGGEPGHCGWLKDKFGLSWQVVPTKIGELLDAKDPARARRVSEALLQMGKLDLKQLQQAYDGR